MSFEAVSSGEEGSPTIDVISKKIEEVDLHDITDLHHEVFGIAGTLRHKIEELGIEHKKKGKVMTKEQCDNIAKHIDDITATWNAQLKIALGKTNREVFTIREELKDKTNKLKILMKANDHLKSKQSQTVKMLENLVANIYDDVYDHAREIAFFFSKLSFESQQKKKIEVLINNMIKVPRERYNTMVKKNEAFFESRTQQFL